ncbi:membrane protein [Marinobacterium zhoushanense]|uniref:Membrane protein n=1 Tax=Marinobacterium zhoushanense TaxID=1679163 RepID=A0ABQ1K9E7_9GAMM|nr:urate hydroxylase PuuD [Marinobacterium zhoushanense]GGB92293.1 membrane protein [Marinobacterium zhoushanense]
MIDAQLTAYLSDWLSLLLRFLHVVTAIAWIGASFYFVWLDNALEEPPKWKKDKGIKGDLWSIHGGGFYEIAKYTLAPEAMPKHLHWFKWEAYSTWITGALLLTLLYYVGANSYLIDPSKADLTPWQAIAIGVGSLLGGFLIYEAAVRSPLINHGLTFGLVMLVLVTLFAWGLNQLFGARAAYIHVGALIGSCMAGNVLLGIMPAQRGLVEAVKRGVEPDPKPALIAKLRSTHNNYATLPVLFIMLSNHYPMTYGHEYGWLILGALALIGGWARHFFNLRHRGIVKPWILVSALLAFCVLLILVRPAPVAISNSGEALTNTEAVALVQKRCATCHSATPTDKVFTAAPSGIIFDREDQVRGLIDRIEARAVLTHDMPFMNKTGMTDEERAKLGGWIARQRQQH